MTTTSPDDPTAAPAAPGRTNPLAVAALASAGAGLVHAAAAGAHNTDSTVAMLFALAAASQFGWAAFTTLYSGRRVAILGAALNTLMVLAWVVSRTRGWPAVDGLREVEPVGTQDLLAAILGTLAAVSAAATLVRPVALRLSRVPVALTSGVLVLALAVPGMAAPHEHGDEGHDGETAGAHGHEDGEDHEGTGETVAAGHDDADHDDADHEDGDHAEHDDDADHAEHDDDADHAEHADGPIISLDDPRVTAQQRKAAQALIDRTETGMSRFTDPASVEAAGYTSIGDDSTGYEHYINVGYIADDVDLDENKIESIVFIVNEDGTRELASAMYILGFGETLDDVPDVAGELTKWHDHQNLCWEGATVVGTTDATGKCERGRFMATPPMLHVWMRDHPCGPFAGIEGHIGEGVCGSHDDHGDGGGAETASGPIISLDDPRVTDDQREAAQALIDETKVGMAKFTDTASVEAAGYASIGDSVTGFEHFINVGYIGDGVDMDPNKIESIVFVVNEDGTKELGSAMYILSPGQTMDTVPDVAGELTKWHDHQNLCWEGIRVVGTTDATGKCERGEFRGTPPMLHVWQVDHPCGPFAGLEGHIGEGMCGHDEH